MNDKTVELPEDGSYAHLRLLMRQTFSTPQGRELLKKLANEHIYYKRFTDNPNKTFFALGKQELVVEFINSLEKDNE